MNTLSRKRLLHAAEKLNGDAWAHACRIATKKQRQRARWQPAHALATYKPCDKAQDLIEAVSQDGHFGKALALAGITPCRCHPGLDYQALLNMALEVEG